MSRVDKLIQELCPDGAEHVDLSTVVRIRNGSDYKSLGEGDVPVYGSGGVMTRVDRSVHPGPSVLIPRKGSLGNLFYVDEPFWTVDTIFYTEIDDAQIIPKFFYYVMFTQRLAEKNQAGGVPSMTQSYLKRLRLPVPPLEVQREIVRILDQFTQLEAELEAELEARRRQYEYYRDRLLTFPEGGRTKCLPMGELGEIFGGLSGKSKADFTDGNARFVSYTNVFNNVTVNVAAEDFVRVAPGERQRTLSYGDVILTGSSESAGEVGMASVVTAQLEEPLYLNSFCIGFRPHGDDLDPEFAKHLFRSKGMRSQIIKTANGVTRFNVSKERLRKVLVPLPSREEQARTAGVLDKFDALANDLSIGLPAELAARRKQYEHYRDRLLTFKELAV